MRSSPALCLLLVALALAGCEGDRSYNYASRCTGGSSGGARALESWLRNNAGKGWSGGIYNCRNVVGGNSYSLHAEGRAVDWMMNAYDGAQKAAGDNLKQVLIGKSAAWGIQEVIWNRRIWTNGGGDRAYSGTNPHVDHLHIGLNWCGANNPGNIGELSEERLTQGATQSKMNFGGNLLVVGLACVVALLAVAAIVLGVMYRREVARCRVAEYSEMTESTI